MRRSVSQLANVAVLGAAGGIGQPLSMLLKLCPGVTSLSCYDVADFTPGVAEDLRHVCTPATVTGHVGPDQLAAALKGKDIVLIPAGLPRKPGMTRDDLFNKNASIAEALATACAEHCPNAALLIIANPVNSTVPIAREVLKKKGVYNPKKLFGVTTLDIVRANTFVADMKGLDVSKLPNVPVVGGHSGVTIVPLLSQIKGVTFTEEEVKTLTNDIQFGGDKVVKTKGGAGSATLSMAYAALRFTESYIAAMNGKSDVVECTFVENDKGTFFSAPVLLGKNGVEKIMDIGPINAYEQGLLDACLPELAGNIKKGIEFVK